MPCRSLLLMAVLVPVLQVPALCAAAESPSDSPHEVVEEDGSVVIWNNDDKSSLHEALIEAANLPIARRGDSLRLVRRKIRLARGRIVHEDRNTLVARGRLENGTEVQIDIVYQFENNRYVPPDDAKLEVRGKRIK